MLIDLFPRAHARFLKLPLLGGFIEGLALWLANQGFSPSPIQRRISKAPVLEAMLAVLGIDSLSELSHERLLSLAPRPAREQRDLSALVRSLAAFLAENGLLAAAAPPRPSELLVRAYLDFLRQVRGLAEWSLRHHRRTALGLLDFLGFDDRPEILSTLSAQAIDAFLVQTAPRLGRGHLQHVASLLRCFLGFLAGRGDVAADLAASIDTPSSQREEKLPRALPLTDDVGAALVDYLQHSGARAGQRSVFLSSRRPAVPLQSDAVRAAFRRRVKGGAVGFPDTGTHCLRHSLALHLLHSDVSIESISGLLGHRSLAATGQYLRVHDDTLAAASALSLRRAALDDAEFDSLTQRRHGVPLRNELVGEIAREVQVSNGLRDRLVVELLGIVDLVAARIPASVEVADVVDVVTDHANYIAFHDLHVVDVVQQLDARGLHSLHQLHAPRSRVAVVVRVVDLGVEQLHQDVHPIVLCLGLEAVEDLGRVVPSFLVRHATAIAGKDDQIGHPRLLRSRDQIAGVLFDAGVVLDAVGPIGDPANAVPDGTG